ncbi:unnamed protein product [Closterium sp. NIES-65]|nr:unnamed protein product [Closterium sp. NIES-65]
MTEAKVTEGRTEGGVTEAEGIEREQGLESGGAGEGEKSTREKNRGQEGVGEADGAEEVDVGGEGFVDGEAEGKFDKERGGGKEMGGDEDRKGNGDMKGEEKDGKKGEGRDEGKGEGKGEGCSDTGEQGDNKGPKDAVDVTLANGSAEDGKERGVKGEGEKGSCDTAKGTEGEGAGRQVEPLEKGGVGEEKQEQGGGKLEEDEEGGRKGEEERGRGGNLTATEAAAATDMNTADGSADRGPPGALPLPAEQGQQGMEAQPPVAAEQQLMDLRLLALQNAVLPAHGEGEGAEEETTQNAALPTGPEAPAEEQQVLQEQRHEGMETELPAAAEQQQQHEVMDMRLLAMQNVVLVQAANEEEEIDVLEVDEEEEEQLKKQMGVGEGGPVEYMVLGGAGEGPEGGVGGVIGGGGEAGVMGDGVVGEGQDGATAGVAAGVAGGLVSEHPPDAAAGGISGAVMGGVAGVESGGVALPVVPGGGGESVADVAGSAGVGLAALHPSRASPGATQVPPHDVTFESTQKSPQSITRRKCHHTIRPLVPCFSVSSTLPPFPTLPTYTPSPLPTPALQGVTRRTRHRTTRPASRLPFMALDGQSAVLSPHHAALCTQPQSQAQTTSQSHEQQQQQQQQQQLRQQHASSPGSSPAAAAAVPTALPPVASPAGVTDSKEGVLGRGRRGTAVCPGEGGMTEGGSVPEAPLEASPHNGPTLGPGEGSGAAEAGEGAGAGGAGGAGEAGAAGGAGEGGAPAPASAPVLQAYHRRRQEQPLSECEGQQRHRESIVRFSIEGLSMPELSVCLPGLSTNALCPPSLLPPPTPHTPHLQSAFP